MRWGGRTAALAPHAHISDHPQLWTEKGLGLGLLKGIPTLLLWTYVFWYPLPCRHPSEGERPPADFTHSNRSNSHTCFSVQQNGKGAVLSGGRTPGTAAAVDTRGTQRSKRNTYGNAHDFAMTDRQCSKVHSWFRSEWRRRSFEGGHDCPLADGAGRIDATVHPRWPTAACQQIGQDPHVSV